MKVLARTPAAFATLLAEISRCNQCAAQLPHGVRPVVQMHPDARILIAAQAPGRKVHESGVPFADASGVRLREWLGLSEEAFYDPRRVAIVPMGFCYPGKAVSGDLPPRPECAPLWRNRLLACLGNVRLTLVIGQYAQAWHLPVAPGAASASVTAAVQAWRDHWPTVMPLPHPSPRNNIWLRRNPWFSTEVLPQLQAQVAQALRE